MVTAPRGRGSSWNGPQRTNFRSQPMEGQRGMPMRRFRPSRPIEGRRCYECGTLGHLSYDCPKRQVQGKFANVMRIDHPSYNEPGKGSSDESDVEEISERGYEKDDYEVEVQGFHGKRTRRTTGKGGSTGSPEKEGRRSRSGTTFRPGTTDSRESCHSRDKQDGSQFWRHNGRNTCEKAGQSLLGCWRGEVDERCMGKLCSPFVTPWDVNKREHKWQPKREQLEDTWAHIA